ncbi:hypothetical protein Tco_0725279 [Tanacetum coccineum]|uniref:Integrase, catalytic region, zinc finger, CCHC-type, peptidase aspartic, catalytic n=1 Tax=Tanacetum coccineum TaxID=301880 RepID=A0ABQ4YDW0_9ASTR
MMRRLNTPYPEAFIRHIERGLMNILEYYNRGAYGKDLDSGLLVYKEPLSIDKWYEYNQNENDTHSNKYEFVNHIQPEWSRFVTTAKQAKDFYKVNFDQLYAYLKQNENDANEVRAIRHRYPDLLALLANTPNPPPSYSSQRSQYNPQPSEYHPYPPYQSILSSTQQVTPSPPQQSYEPLIFPQQSHAPSTQLNSGFVVPSFLPTDDPMASLNKAIMFLNTAINLIFSPTNNQLRTSSNLRTQATIQDGRVTVQNLHTTSIFKADHVDAFDSNYDEAPTTNAIFMARLSLTGSINRDDVNITYDSDILSKIPHYDTNPKTDMLNPVVQETEYSEHLVSNNDSYDELTTQRKQPVLYNANVLAERHDPISVCDFEETLVFVDESRLKMKEKQKEHDDKPIDYAKLNKHYEYFVPQQQLSTEQVYWSPVSKLIPPLVSVLVEKPTPPKVFPKKLPTTSMVKESLKKVKNHLDKFDECIKERTVVNVVNWGMDHIKGAYEEEKVHDALLITDANNKSFVINDLKAQLQDKSIVVNDLKQLLAKLKGKSQVTPYETTYIDSRFQKLDDENMSLTFKVSSLVKEREHLKLVYKNLYDSIKQTRAQNKLKIDSLQQKLANQIYENTKLRAQLQVKSSEPQLNRNGTSVNTKFAKPPTLGNKLYSVTLFPKTQFIPKVVEKNDLSKIVTSHFHTNKELIEKARALKYLDENLDYAYTSRTNTSVVNDTQKHVVKQNIQKTDNTLLPSTRRVSYTYASGSQPKSNTRNDRIQRPSSRSQKNKVEAQHRKFKSISNKNNHVLDCNANVKNVALSSNSKNVCLLCNECLFYANHDACVVKYLKDVQKRKKAKSVKQKGNIQWKLNERVFTIVGHRWIPSGRTFNMVGTMCPLTKITPATIVPSGNKLQTISNPGVAPNAETRMRYSIVKNSLIRAHINCYGHPFNKHNFTLMRKSEVSKRPS